MDQYVYYMKIHADSLKKKDLVDEQKIHRRTKW